MMIDDDDKSEESHGPFEQGHWIWNDDLGQLSFISDLPEKEDGYFLMKPKLHVAKFEFNEDFDPFEQQRFKNHYQRKSLPLNDVVLLQDIVDVVLYTAPRELVTSRIIKMLHLSLSENFLRALIFYCQYYLQVGRELERRLIESESTISTALTYEIQDELKDNLIALRVLVAKEYTAMLLGEMAIKSFHHMGPTKSHGSLSQKGIETFEIFMKISTQIVWIALNRKFYNEIGEKLSKMLNSLQN